MAVYLTIMRRLGAFENLADVHSRNQIGPWTWAVRVVGFLWLPILIMGVYAFNSSNVQSWPIPGFTTHWFSVAWHDSEVSDALVLSLKAGLSATAVALVLGTVAAFALVALPFLRAERRLVHLRPADRPPRDHHRNGAELVLRLLVDRSSASGRS